MTPLVSVITPCHRQAHFLPDALESVLSQSCSDLEMIVVDDGSPDDTHDVAARYAERDPRVRCVAQSNRGLAAARNAGLALATGTYVVFLDADDRLLPDALVSGIASLEQHPRAAYTRGRFDVVDVDGALLDLSPEDDDAEESEYETLLRRSPIWLTASVMFRRSIFDSIAPFDSRVDAAADLELYLRVARFFPVTRHATTVAWYRRHAESMSMNRNVMALAVFGVLQAQRAHVGNSTRWRAALRDTMREWERRHLVPMMRRALRELMHLELETVIVGHRLMVRRGPRALARALLGRVGNERRRREDPRIEGRSLRVPPSLNGGANAARRSTVVHR